MMTEKLIDPKEHEIKLSFHNYKLLKKKDFNLKGSCIYFVKGPNGVGKTTILNGLKAAQEIKDDTPEKVTRGEAEGRNEFNIPGPDGKTYMVAYEFDQNKVKFIVIDQDGNKISRITDMREIFGYQHISAKEFISWSRSAEGRRKQKQFILDLLPPESYLKYTELEEEEEENFKLRRDINRKCDETKNIVKEFELTDDEKAKFKKEDQAKELLDKYKKKLAEIMPDEASVNTIKNDIKTINDKIEIVQENYDGEINLNSRAIKENTSHIEELELQLEQIKNKINYLKNENIALKESNDKVEKNKIDRVNELTKEREELNKKLDKAVSKESVEDIGKIKESIEKGEEFIDQVERLHIKMDKYVDYSGKLDNYMETSEELTNKITNLRTEKEKIIEHGEFPVESLSFDEEGYLVIDGFRFDENQICESDTILLVSEILCKTNKSIIQIVGDASVLDFEKLDKLNEIAEQNGKVMFVDEVDREIGDLVIVGYEEIKTTKGRTTKAGPKKKKTEDTKAKEDTDDNPLF